MLRYNWIYFNSDIFPCNLIYLTMFYMIKFKGLDLCGRCEVSGCMCRVLNGHWFCHTGIKLLLEAVGGYPSIHFFSIQDRESSMWIWPIRWLLRQPIGTIQRKSAWQGGVAAGRSGRCHFSSWPFQPITNYLSTAQPIKAQVQKQSIVNQCASAQKRFELDPKCRNPRHPMADLLRDWQRGRPVRDYFSFSNGQ